MINSIAISSYNKQILTTSDDKTIRLWDMETHQQLREMRGIYL
jgi:WD40 repeat protein